MNLNQETEGNPKSLPLILYNFVTFISILASILYLISYFILPFYLYGGQMFDLKYWITTVLYELSLLQTIAIVVGTFTALYFFLQSLYYSFKPYKVFIDRNGITISIILSKNHTFSWNEILSVQAKRGFDEKNLELEIKTSTDNTYRYSFSGEIDLTNRRIDAFKKQ